MKNSILGKARWLRDVALATSKNNGARVAREWLKIAAVFLLIFTLGVGNAWGTSVTYQHVFNAKPSTGNNVSLSSVSWNISATNLNSYNSANYAGVQFGTSKANGSISLTSSSAWGSSGTYNGKTKITEIRLWFNLGGSSVTPSVTIGGVSAVSDGTVVTKNSSAGSDWTKTSKVTFTPGTNGNSGVVVISASSTKAGYICCMEIDCEEPAGGGCSDPASALAVSATPTTIYASTGTSTLSVGSTGNGSTVTYSVTSANSTYATISEGVFSATRAGSYTVQASQDEDDGVCGGTATVDITVRYQVKWSVNGNDAYNTGSPTTYIGTHDTKVTTLPTNPASALCDGSKVFVGWTKTPIVGTTNTVPSDLFTTVAGSPTITANTTFYAVFATQATATFIASDLTNTPATSNDREWKHTASGTLLYLSAGQYYTGGTPYTWTVTSGTSNYARFTAGTGKTITQIVVTISGTNYKINSVTKGSLSTSSTTQTITGINNNTVDCKATSSYQIRITQAVVTYVSAFATTCCTSLASINGSIKSISGTSATLKWDNLSYVDGTTPYSVTVSPSAGTTVGSISTVDGYKNCTITGLTAGTEYTFTINAYGDATHCNSSQEVVATTPKITLGSASGTSTYIEGNGPGSKQTFTVTAVGLTGNLTVTAPTNFAVCATENGSYTSSITLTPTSGAVSTTVYFRLVADKTAASSPYAGSVTVSGGSATEQTVAVNGTVSPACEAPTINTQPAASATYNLNVAATALSVVATKNGTGPALSYQWYRNTANSKTTPTPTAIDDATSASYTPPTNETGTKYYFCEVSSGACAVTTNISAITVSTPSITVSTTSIAFGDRAKDGSFTETFTVSGSNLASGQGLTLSVTGTNAALFSVSPSSKAQTSAGAVSTTTITVTYAPNAIGDHSATITISSTGATSKTVTLSGSSKYKITWVDQAANPATESYSYVASGKPTFPSDPTGGCNSYTYFYGWAEGTFTTPVTAPGTSSTVKVYKEASEMPNVSGNVTYYAVWADSPGGLQKVTSVGVNDVIVITNKADDKEFTGIYMPASTYIGQATTFSTTPAGTYPLTVVTGYNSTGVALKNGNNYLLGSSSNDLANTEDLSAASSWTLEYDGENDDWSITNNDQITRRIRFNGSTNPNRFCTYTTAQSGIHIWKQSSAGNCVTSCCTEVAARSGSVSMGSTSATVSWSVTGTAASKISSWDVSCNVTGGAAAGTKGSISTSGTTKSVEFTGLNPNTGYTFHILGTSNDDAYCDVDDELTGTTECLTPALSVTGTWGLCAGEELSLSLTSTSNIDPSATYQWKKYVNSAWENIPGATSSTYTVASCTKANAGSYCCTVTNPGTGSCSATSDPFGVKVYTVYIDDGNNSNWQHIDLTNDGTSKGKVTITLDADKTYHFKIYDNNNVWYGQTGTGNIPDATVWTLNGSNNVNLATRLGGGYLFEVNYASTPTVKVTFPEDDQAANKKIWFDNSIRNWSTMYYRIGNDGENQNSTSFTPVTGTDNFYVVNTLAQTDVAAWHIANNASWSGSNSIYKVDGSGYAITEATAFQKYLVGSDGVTLVPVTPSSGSSDGCAWYDVTKTDGMLTHTATITPPTNGTIHLAYTDVSGTAQDKTSTTAGLAHRTMIKATASPAAGYELTTFTVTPAGGAARSLLPLAEPAEVNHILAEDATFAATFSAKTITITWNANGGNTPSPTTSSYTYNGSTVSLATVTHATKLFAGWWTDPSAGTQITEIGTTNKPTEDVTYYAHWVDGNTVYFHPGVGSVTPTSATQTSIGGSVSIPTPTIDCDGWSFAGWNVGSALAETTTNPEASLVAGGSSYVPASATVNMYAVWKKNFGGGTGDVTNTYTWETTNNAWLTGSISGVTTYSTIAHTGTYAGEMSATSAYVQFLTKLSSPLSFKIYYTQTSNNDNSANKWDVQISDNGSSWTTVTSSEGANKSYKNTWRELDVNLSSYSNKYVRVAWGSANSGSFVLDDVSVSYTGTIPDAWKWTSSADDYGCVPANQVKTPVISPDEEAQTGDVSVTITCATAGATIRYTTDGTTPTSSEGTVYSGAFTVSCSGTVKAIAYKATMDDSNVATQDYTVTVPTPTFGLAPGTYYDANQSVTLSLPTAHTGTVIKYTTNGDDPTSSSATYSSAITVTEGTTTIKAIGYNSTCSASSAVASATYIVRFGETFSLVTDKEDLMAGDRIVIVSADATTSTHHAVSTTISSNKRTATTDFNLAAGLATAKIYPALGAAATVQVFTLGGKPGEWTFYESTNSGYLNCPSAGKLTNTANVSNSNKWTIDINGSYVATITNNDVDAVIKSNTSSDHVFAAYGPATENVQLVKLYSVPNPDPVIKIEASLSAFSSCAGNAGTYQSFYVSGKNLTGNMVISGPMGYEFCSTSGGTYTSTLTLVPSTGTVARQLVYVRLASSAAAGTHNGNITIAVSANSLSEIVAITGSATTSDTFTDRVHNTVVASQCGSYSAPSCDDTTPPTTETDCTTTHYKFMGWVAEGDLGSLTNDAAYKSHLIPSGTAMTASGTTYYAVWAEIEE